MGAQRNSCRFAVAALSAALLVGNALATSYEAEPVRATAEYNVGKAGLAASGYDVVAYFPEGGGKPTKGDKAFERVDRGVTYRFATRANMELFEKNPDRYIPAHGGWCSWAMAEDGSKVEVDPASFIVDNGRLFLFYKGLLNDTRSKFQKDVAANAARADVNWKKLTGEAPILPGAETQASPGPLQTELDALRDRFERAAPEETRRVYEEGIQKVAESGVMESALKVGAIAPDFALPDATGKSVRLSELLKEGPVVLTWYRGGWCPYCNIQLRAYQESLGQIRDAGGQLVALSPERPDNSLSTKEKNGLEFTVLSDVGSGVAREYGVSYRLPDSLIEAFKGRLDLPASNGDDSWELPLGATYVIARDGTIAYAFLSADYRERAEPEAVVEALKKLR